MKDMRAKFEALQRQLDHGCAGLDLTLNPDGTYADENVYSDFCWFKQGYQAALAAVPAMRKAKPLSDADRELLKNEFYFANDGKERDWSEQESQAQQPSIEDVQSLVDSSEIMLKWCVKNVQQWNFSEYDWLHRATEKVKASLPPAPEGEKE